MKFLSFAVVVLLPALVSAEPPALHQVSKIPSGRPGVVRDSVVIASEALVDFIQRNVHRSNRAVHTYHYADKKSMGVDPNAPLDFADPKVKDHVKDWTAFAWSPKQPLSGAEDFKSVYLAQDPFTSRSYGKNAWALYRVILPAGMRLFDLATMDANEKQNRMPPSLIKALEDAGCPPKAHYNSIDSLMRKFATEGCRQVLLRTFRDLDIDAIVYDWTRGDNPHYPGRRGRAVILLQTDKLGPDSVAIYDEFGMGGAATDTDRRRIEAMYRSGRKHNAERGSDFGPPTLWDIAPEAPTKEWMEDKLIWSDRPWW